MKVTLKELCWLLRDEHRGLTELQQQFAKAKATWETERAELKSHTALVSVSPVRDIPLLVPVSAKVSAVRLGNRMACHAPRSIGITLLTLWPREGKSLD